jgi:hypothetical protein
MLAMVGPSSFVLDAKLHILPAESCTGHSNNGEFGDESSGCHRLRETHH